MTPRITRLYTVLADEAGYVSILEAAVTIAVGVILAAVIVPTFIGLPNDAKISRAKGDVIAIQGAITAFFSDTTEFPVRDQSGKKTSVPLAGGQTAVVCLRTGSAPAADPGLAPGKNFLPSCLGAGLGNFLNNHLVFDADPARSLRYRAGDAAQDTPPRRWQGPYIGEIHQDPWGRNYMVLAFGMLQATGSDGRQSYARALSAGPNGVLETDHFDASPQGDDIGILISALNP